MIDSKPSTLRELIDEMAWVKPETAFLINPENGRTISFSELRQQSIRLSCLLQQSGLVQGDKVAFLMDNGLLTAQLFLGTMYGGFVSVPLNVRAGVMQLSYMLQHCEARIVFVEARYEALIREARGAIECEIRLIPTDADDLPSAEAGACSFVPPLPVADDVALLMYSSGSTGTPKAAIHTHGSILAGARNSICSHQLSSLDRSLLVLPLYHINAECVTLIPTLLSGGSVVLPHRFSVSLFWDWMTEHSCTWSALVPTIVSELVDWHDPGGDGRQNTFQNIRFFRSSSAPLSPSLQRRFLDKFPVLLIQAMGSTEAGNVFSNPLPPHQNKIGSPGLPWGFETKIVDRDGAEVKPGEPGEVLIRGKALTRGYFKDSEGTAAAVDPDGWLRTGDLAYRDDDGYFFVVGRSKELIIKGGVNIAPRQIDEVLESHDGVLEAAAVGVPDPYLGEDLVAFVVPRSQHQTDEKQLLAYCESRLGPFKTPTRIHFLKDLPKGPSGKVQRLRLLEETLPLVQSKATWSAGETASAVGTHTGSNGAAKGLSIEQVIATTWAEVLTLPEVDASSNFFALGGHSLLAIQCLSRLREKLPVALSLSDFFENSTVARQAALVRRKLRPDDTDGGVNAALLSGDWEEALLRQFVPLPGEEPIPQRDSTLPCPLSPAQQRLWFLEQLNPGVPVYNEAEAVRLTGELNVEALREALNVVVSRHELLRSTIQTEQGVPHFLVHEIWPLRFEQIDLTTLPHASRESALQGLLVEKPRVSYNLEAEPGIRAALVRMGPQEHVFILMMHHIVFDWSSEGVFWRELSTLYRSLCKGESGILPALPIRHGDYAAWQTQQDESGTSGDDLSFWEENLRSAPPLLELPADRPRPPVLSHRGARLRWKLNPVLTAALRNAAKREDTSLFTIFAAVLNILIYRYTGNEDIPLGIPLAARDHKQLQGLIGFLLHVHVLRTTFSGEMKFCDLLSRVQKGFLDLYAHRAAPFDEIVRKLHPARNPGYSPLFQVMLNWRDCDQTLEFIGMDGLEIESLMAHSATSKFDLTLVVTDGGDEIWLEMEYSTDLFDEARIARMLGHYETLLEAVAGADTRSLDSLPLLKEEEQLQLLYEWNDTRADYPRDQCIHELFEAQVERTPEAQALIFEDARLSYAELNRRSNRLAHYLRGLGIKPDSRVAICMEPGFEAIVALLAVLKAGGAYVPMDPAYPAERLRYMLEDSAPMALLTKGHLTGMLTGSNRLLPVLDMGTEEAPWKEQPASNPTRTGVGITPENLAYVIYTSGSTGKPKGVMVEHRGLCNLVAAQIRGFAVRPDSRVLQFASFSFDACVSEVFVSLCAGASLLLTRQREWLTELIDFARQGGVTHATLPPALLAALSEQAGVHSIPILIAAGEALTEEVATSWGRGRRLINAYGPTEATVCATMHDYRPERSGKPPIGRPIANTRIYILDSHRNPAGVGVTGELYIAGVGVARGYLNQPELTAERFLPDPFGAGDNARMYKTGDLGRWLPDGTIEYVGRDDFQVKIRGFRIEPGEIESVLRSHFGVRDAVVVVREGGEKQLVAYVVAEQESDCTPAELRNYIKQRLPDYMVPAAWVVLPALPLTPNGKVDRKALQLSGANAMAASSAAYVPPDSEIERKTAAIWQGVLGIDKVGIEDNFFDLGGNSLLIVTVHNRLRQAFTKDITVVDMFRWATIRELAQHLSGRSDLSVSKVVRADGEMRKETIQRHRQLRRDLANELLMEASEHAQGI